MSSFAQRLSILVRTDRQFRSDFTDQLLKFRHNDDNRISGSLIDRIANYLRKDDPKEIELELTKILNDPKIIPIVRVMRSTDRNSWIRRFRDFVFSDDTGIDLFRVSNSLFEIEEFQAFQNLRNEERSFLQQLTIPELDFLSLGVRVFLTNNGLSRMEKSFLLSLDAEQIDVIIKFGFRRTRLLANYDGLEGFDNDNPSTRDRILDLIDSERVGGPSALDSKERAVLVDLIYEKREIIKNFAINFDELLKEIRQFSEADADKLDRKILRSLSGTEGRILMGFDFRILRMAGTLTRTQLDGLLDPPRPAEIYRLKVGEEATLEALSPSQRIVLARVYNLPPSAVGVLHNLSLDRMNEVIILGLGSTRGEEFVCRKMKELSPADRYDIRRTTKKEWYAFQGIQHFNLSVSGIAVLKATILLNEDQLDFVKRMSRSGLAVLAENSSLSPTRINEIMGLTDDEEKRHLLNLDPHRGINITETEDSSELIDSDRNTVFEIWKLIFDPGTREELAGKMSKLDSRLLAHVVIASRFTGYNGMEIMNGLDFLVPIFFMELLQKSIEDGLDEGVSLRIVRQIRGRSFAVEDLARAFDYSTAPQVELLKWMLSRSSRPGYQILYDIARVVFFDRTKGKNVLDFGKIQGIVPGLHEQLKAERLRLARAIEDSTWLSTVLKPEECLSLLEYHDGAVPLLKTLREEDVIRFFNSDAGEEFLHSGLSDGRVDLAEFLRSYSENLTIRRSFVDHVRSVEHARNLAFTLDMLRDIVPADYCTAFILRVQRIAPPETTAEIVRLLMRGSRKSRDLLDPQVLTLVNATVNGCKWKGSAPCVDSRDLREMSREAKAVFNEGRNLDIELHKGLLESIESSARLLPKIQMMIRDLERNPGGIELIRKAVRYASFEFAMFLIANKDTSGYHALNLTERMDPIPKREDYWDTKFLAEHIRAVEKEDVKHYWSLFWSDETTGPMETTSGARDVLQRYISKIFDRFGAAYDTIGMSLPRWIIGKNEYVFRHVSCTAQTIASPAKLIFDRKAVARNPYYGVPAVGLLPSRIGDRHMTCGPSASQLEIETVLQDTSPHFYEYCSSRSGGVQYRTFTERYRLPGNEEDRCQNMVLYQKHEPSRMMVYVAQEYFDWQSSRNDPMDLIFLGKDITINDSGIESPTNRFLLKNDLLGCCVRKKGLNFFYTDKIQLLCDVEGSDNVAVVYGDFVDSENILSVIGNEKSNKITIGHARFVDGGGGNDIVTAGNSTVVRAHKGDLITGGAMVVLPGRIDEIESITVETTTFVFHYDSGAILEVDQNCRFITANDYHLFPIQVRGSVWGIRLHRISDAEIDLEELKRMRNAYFYLVKQSTSPNKEIILTEMESTTFTTKSNRDLYHWEAPSSSSNLYIFNQSHGNVTISQTNGILNFGPLNSSRIDFVLSKNKQETVTIRIKDLRVSLLSNYNRVKITFDGKEYYKFASKYLERDYCSHPLRVRGKISIDHTKLTNHHDCLDFDTEKVHFLKTNENLILVSDDGAILLTNYSKSLNLSLRYNSVLMEPDEFRRRAENPSSMKYYRVDDRGLQIYHNQPEDKFDIGFVDLEGWSITKSRIELSKDSLFLVHEQKNMVEVENWVTRSATREMIFNFKNEILLNTQCIVSNCRSDNILDEFRRFKSRHMRSERDVTGGLVGYNLSILMILLHSLYPIPAERVENPEEILIDACRITQEFEEVLRNAGEELDFFDLYGNVVKWMREGKYSSIAKSFHEIAERVGLDAKRKFSHRFGRK